MRSVGTIMTAKLSPACAPSTLPNETPVRRSTRRTASGRRPRRGSIASEVSAMASSTQPNAASPGLRLRIHLEATAAPAARPTRNVVSIAAKA